MQVFKNNIIFSPTDLVRFFESEFASYMDHFEKISSKETLKDQNIHRDPRDSLYDVIIGMGNEHEKEVIKNLEKTQIIKIEKDKYNKESCIEQTLSAMKNGADKIYQATLGKDNIFGYVDILEKKEGPSDLGDYHYAPCDIKISTHPKPSAIIQLCCYCDILETIQKTLPEKIKIITKDKTAHLFYTKQFFYFYQFLKQRFLNYHSDFDLENIPIPNKHKDHKDWTLFSKKMLHTLNDISLVANIRQIHCEALKKQNINTMTDFSRYDENQITGIPKTTLRKLKDQAILQVSSKKENQINFKVLSDTEEGQGLEMLPPQNKLDVFFDMEGYPFLAEEGLEYLYGNAINTQPEYISFWAENKLKEIVAFKNWVHWVYDRWKQNPGMHIYHYGHYETSTLKRLMGRYAIGEFEIDNLLRNHVFVDLHKVVTQGLRIGAFSYSLKEIEKLYYEKRDTQVQSGADSAVEFFYFLNSGKDKKDSPFLKKIEDYNRDDCFSTKELCHFLWRLQKTHNINYTPLNDDLPGEQQEKSGIKGLCEKKAQELLSHIPKEKRALALSETEAKFYIGELLASLLEFHIREDKPGWWKYFEHFKKDDSEKLEDRHTITSCRVIKNKGIKYKIKFEQEQEIGFEVGDRVLVLENKKPQESYKILELNLIEKTLCLDVSQHNHIPTSCQFTLVEAKNDFYKINIFKSLLETASRFSFNSNNFGLKKCIHDLLLRCSPDLPGYKGPLILEKKNLMKEASDHALNLNHSVLCIQGPPGSGKTYTAAHIILNLVQRGKRIGVTSNSHKAVLKLLEMLFEQNKNNIRLKCQKVYKKGAKEEEQMFIGNYPIELVEQVEETANIVGGTVYFFSRENQRDSYDYLFVDEASQVSLANVVSAARSAKNIILLGDQNQLEQPIQGTHPGESGKSALTYYTDGKITIPENKGVFLPISYRMNPKTCKFISENFYNERLNPYEKNKNQKIILPSSLKKQLPDSGVCFIPVDHSGNREASLEEAEIISDLYKQLLQAQWVDKEGNKSAITIKDILIVAPYNLQVAYLKRKLDQKNARIASVDKFQGQEAPISILSMTASTLQEAPRGISFLLNKNRLNVAVSRAKCLSIIVGSKNLLDTNMSSIQNMELMNIWCRITKHSSYHQKNQEI